MVYVNSQKFACASCIKGHRSSSCHHTERPLFEIKKKGRPVSQCEKCRNLRKNKHIHVKCSCTVFETASGGNKTSTTPESPLASHRPAQRKLPAKPTLPNGLRDFWSKEPLSPVAGVHPKQRVEALLNPCKCKSMWKCKCFNRGGRLPVQAMVDEVQVAADVLSLVTPSTDSCFTDSSPAVIPNTPRSAPNDDPSLYRGTEIPTQSAAAHREGRHPASTPHARSPPFALPTASLCSTHDETDNLGMSLTLPPLIFPDTSGNACNNTSSWMLPSLRNITPAAELLAADAIASLTRCGCGSTCVCPGCKEHRGEELAATSGEDCPDECGTCVDHMGGLALPIPYSIIEPSSGSDPSRYRQPSDVYEHSRDHLGSSSTGMSTLERFYAIAELLPLPPTSSRTFGPGTLDTTNVTVYRQPPVSGVQKQHWQKVAGLVQVPPLNCCAGRCKCPGGMCGCGTECGGSCGQHGTGPGAAKGKEREYVVLNFPEGGKENGCAKATGNCCARKKVPPGVTKNPASRSVLRL